VFQETPDYGKPTFIYYTSSANRGATWSKPVTLSNDNTGNGAGYPRILQDGSGRIYAIWKRYGSSTGKYPQKEANLDGPGGQDNGTVMYKVLSGGTWSAQVQLNELEQSQVSWFATVSPQGFVYVFWTQASAESVKNNRAYWTYCDYLRYAALNGTSYGNIVDMNTPVPPANPGGFPAEKKGAINLQGYVDNAGLPHLIYVDAPDDIKQIKYFDGKSQRVVYTYPAAHNRVVFEDPAHLLVDEAGNDHLILLPSATVLESEQIWDINLATNKTNVLTSLQSDGANISGLQASQGPKGTMAVTFEAGTRIGNTDTYGMFYSNGVWKNVGLTANAAKNKFFSKEFIGVGGWVNVVASSTTYNSKFASVAYDAAGKKSMIMNISAYTIGNGYSLSKPSIVFLPIDK
jgi:hypothetical protein